MSRGPFGMKMPGGLAFLPTAGGGGDQPAVLMDAISIMESKIAEFEK